MVGVGAPGVQCSRPAASRGGSGAEPERLLDPDLVSAYMNVGFFAFATMAPWPMMAVGLEPRDYETRLDEIIDVSVRLTALSVGSPTGS